MESNDYQIGGSHYKATVQHWDYVIEALDGRYLEGNISKYIARYHKKNGLQDVRKAAHYLTKLIDAFNRGDVQPPPVDDPWPYMDLFLLENARGVMECRVLRGLAEWRTMDDLITIQQCINTIAARVEAEDRRAEAIKAGAEPGAGYVNQG